MNFKKRVNGSWHDTPHYIHNTSTDTITTLPAVLYPNDTTATVGLKGNTVQSTTPTPQNPVMPQGTGERTRQIIPKIVQGGVNANNGNLSTSTTRIRTEYVSIEEGQTYTITGGDLLISSAAYYLNCEFVSSAIQSSAYTKTVTIPSGVNQIAIGFRNLEGTDIAPENATSIMMNTGSQPLPYEPFGVKIPISSAGQVTPVYLGEVQTTRKIQKLVLTGQESWYFTDSNRVARLEISDYMKNPTNIVICSHYKGIAPVTGYAAVGNGEVAFHKSANYLYICDGTITGNNYITFLQQQYANGTPVTVWYVLSEPTTGIVNEPLMKIGDYADEVSNVSIPVTAGGDTLSVGTTVQPSEVTVNYKGWHSVADVHERENGAWD